jgi:hypothetical protein
MWLKWLKDLFSISLKTPAEYSENKKTNKKEKCIYP